jgi:hypothetical protein
MIANAEYIVSGLYRSVVAKSTLCDHKKDEASSSLHIISNKRGFIRFQDGGWGDSRSGPSPTANNNKTACWLPLCSIQGSISDEASTLSISLMPHE